MQPQQQPGAAAAGAAGLPLANIELGYRRLLFPDLPADVRPPVVYFDVVDRFTAFHQRRRRYLFISTLGTLYMCNPHTGNVTHSVSLVGEGTHITLEVDRGKRPNGERAMLLHRRGDPDEAALVVVFDCRDIDKCGPLFNVLRHFLKTRERLRVTMSDDVLKAFVDKPQRSLPKKMLDRVFVSGAPATAGAGSGGDALRGVQHTVSSMRASGKGRPQLMASAADGSSIPSPTGTTAAAPGNMGAPMPSSSTVDGSSGVRLGGPVSGRDVLHGQKQQQQQRPASHAPPLPARGDRVAWRARMERHYRHHCPDKLPSLEAALNKYAGHEDVLLEAMVAKYGPEPPFNTTTTTTTASAEVPSTTAPSTSGGVAMEKPLSATGAAPPPVHREQPIVTASSSAPPLHMTSARAEPAAVLGTSGSGGGGGHHSQPTMADFTDEFAMSGPPATSAPTTDDVVAHYAAATTGGGAGGMAKALPTDASGTFPAHQLQRQPSMSVEEAESRAMRHLKLLDEADSLAEECAAIESETRAIEAQAAAVREAAASSSADGTGAGVAVAVAREVALAQLVLAICSRRLAQRHHEDLARRAKAKEARAAETRRLLAELLE